jgi:hypothetical protein
MFTNLDVGFSENTEWNLGARAPSYEKNQKVLFKSFQKNSSKFLHLHIMLIVTRVRFHKKIPLYVAYTKWQNANSYSLVSFGHFVIVV